MDPALGQDLAANFLLIRPEPVQFLPQAISILQMTHRIQNYFRSPDYRLSRHYANDYSLEKKFYNIILELTYNGCLIFYKVSDRITDPLQNCKWSITCCLCYYDYPIVDSCNVVSIILLFSLGDVCPSELTSKSSGSKFSGIPSLAELNGDDLITCKKC